MNETNINDLIVNEDICEYSIYLLSILEKYPYREINIEAWYQELLENKNRSKDEQIIFEVMSCSRQTFLELDRKYLERIQFLDERCQKISPKFKTRTQYFDWDGRPIQSWEYHFKHGYFSNHVQNDIIDGWQISTVWLGLDHSFFVSSDPIIFETMIFKNDETLPDNEEFLGYQERYSYLSQAEEGHKNTCEFVKKGLSYE